MTGIVTWDLDSTMADTTHRQHLITRLPDGRPTDDMDWIAYAMACAKDAIVGASFRLAHLLAAHYEIHYLTGRPAQSRDLTSAWIKEQGLPMDGLWMDEDGIHGSSRGSHAQYKLNKIRHIEAETGQEVLLHVDDWASVKVLLEANDIPCICVRTPDEVLQLTGDIQ